MNVKVTVKRLTRKIILLAQSPFLLAAIQIVILGVYFYFFADIFCKTIKKKSKEYIEKKVLKVEILCL